MIGAPKPEEILDPSFGVIVGFYLERAVFRLPVKILANASRGQQTVVVQVRFQTCNGRLCLAPTTVKLPVQLEIR